MGVFDFLKKKKDEEKKKEEKSKTIQIGPKEIKDPKIFQVIKRPIISEKSKFLLSLNQYVFEVDPKANKPLIKQAVEKLFGVKVKKVRTLKIASRTKQGRKGKVLVRPSYKKAIVTLEPGHKIDLFES